MMLNTHMYDNKHNYFGAKTEIINQGLNMILKAAIQD